MICARLQVTNAWLVSFSEIRNLWSSEMVASLIFMLFQSDMKNEVPLLAHLENSIFPNGIALAPNANTLIKLAESRTIVEMVYGNFRTSEWV